MTLLPRNPIRWVAVICVAIISGYIMWMGYRLVEILASPGWCGKALQAEKISSQNFGGLTACVDILKIQLTSLARTTLIYSGSISLSLVVLIVIVIAAGKLDLELPEKLGGGGIHMGRNGQTPREEGANKVAAAAVSEAGNVAAEETQGAQIAPGEDG